MAEFKCECGGSFDAAPCHYNRGTHRYCSPECRKKYNRRGSKTGDFGKKQCASCGAIFISKFRSCNKCRYGEMTKPNPSGLCRCGCGKPTPIARYTKAAKGYIAGQPTNYLTGHSSKTKYAALHDAGDGQKPCAHCRESKPLADFYWAYPRVKDRRHSYCKKCMHVLRWPSFRKTKTRRMGELAGRPRPDTCELCGSDGRICFDHCHKSEKFRGWICHRCNSVLGLVRDDAKLLRDLADYLEKGLTLNVVSESA